MKIKNKISGFHLIITKFQKIIKRCKKLKELNVVVRNLSLASEEKQMMDRRWGQRWRVCSGGKDRNKR
jgi:hypothetical protein